MLTRRQALALASAGVALAVIRTAAAGALRPVVHSRPDAPRAGDSLGDQIEFVPDRELRISLGDRLTSQSWTYAGQSYEERRDRIIGNEGECILLTIVNDTANAQRVD